eukprot:317036_1
MEPTTNNPTISPTTSNPSISPTIYTISPTISPSDISISPSISPSIHPTISQIGVNDDTTEIPNNNGNGDSKTGNNNKGILDSTTLGIIIAVSVVSFCMICGIIILYKQRKKKKEKDKTNTDSDYY